MEKADIFYSFCLIILAYSLSRLWRRTFFPVPIRCPRDDGTLKAPHCPPPRPVPRRCDAYVPRKLQRKDSDPRKEQRKGASSPYFPSSSSADAMKEGVGGNSGSSSPEPNSPAAPSSSAAALRSSSRSRSSRSSHPEASLPASSSAGTSLPTSVVDRESSIARLHLPSARRYRTFHRQ